MIHQIRIDELVTTSGGIHVDWSAGGNVETLLEIVRLRLEQYQGGKMNCPENDAALEGVNCALVALQVREDRRTEAGVEGSNNEPAAEDLKDVKVKLDARRAEKRKRDEKRVEGNAERRRIKDRAYAASAEGTAERVEADAKAASDRALAEDTAAIKARAARDQAREDRRVKDEKKHDAMKAGQARMLDPEALAQDAADVAAAQGADASVPTEVAEAFAEQMGEEGVAVVGKGGEK